MKSQDLKASALFPVASRDRVNRSVFPGSAEAVKMTVISGRKCCELSKKSGPVGCLERMLLGSSIWNSTMRLLTWKAKVTKQRRLYYQLVASVPHIKDIELPLWVTPTANDAINSSLPPSQINRNQLVGQIMRQIYPTPTTGAGLCGGSGNYQQLKALEQSGQITQEERQSMSAGNGGQLNPMWVEWLMGFPIGWTD